jgi:hypothetical protein
VPIDAHIEQIKIAIFNDDYHIRYSNLWHWLDDKFDIGQYYSWKEQRNYLVFHDEKHYLIFLLKL